MTSNAGLGTPSANADSIDRAAEGAVPTGRPSRRTVLLGAGVVSVAAAAGTLAACGGAGSNTVATTPPTPGPLTKTSDIPVGGGKIFARPQVVVVQATAGNFKAFSSICTHAGCAVSQISGGTILCPCHGSEYSITDGSVVRGPATSPLPAQAITVADGEISIA